MIIKIPLRDGSDEIGHMVNREIKLHNLNPTGYNQLSDFFIT